MTLTIGEIILQGPSKKSHLRLLVLVLTYKELRCHCFYPYNKKKAKITLKSMYFLDPLDNWGCRANRCLKCGETGKYRKTQKKISLPEAEATGSLNQYIYIKLLEDEHELAWKWENHGGQSYIFSYTFMGFNSRTLTRFPWWTAKTNPSYFWQREGEVTFLNMSSAFSITKAYSPVKRILPEPYLTKAKGHLTQL